MRLAPAVVGGTLALAWPAVALAQQTTPQRSDIWWVAVGPMGGFHGSTPGAWSAGAELSLNYFPRRGAGVNCPNHATGSGLD